jgi:hypothetical protein
VNITLNAEELLHVFQTLLRHPMNDPRDQDILIEKVKNPIRASIEKSEEAQTLSAFETWSQKEKQKIDDLNRKNASLKDEQKPKVKYRK